MRPSLRLGLLNLLLVGAAFGVVFVVYSVLFPEQLSELDPFDSWGELAVAVAAFWIAAQLQERTDEQDAWLGFMELFCFGTGLNLVLQGLCAYLFGLHRNPFLIVAGSLLATVALAVASRLLTDRSTARFRWLLVGYDGVTKTVVSVLRQPVIGAVGMDPAETVPGIPSLGSAAQLEEIVSKHKPNGILVTNTALTAQIPPALLFDLRRQGLVIEAASVMYERLLSRVCSARLEPTELVLSPALRASSRMMAIQAIYTNLIGLFFLLLLLPLLVVISIAVALSSGPGPTFESVSCLGFQKIPFRLLRFRTYRLDRQGPRTFVGEMINRLHLTNLPQLMNIVRGEMALFGPRPIRQEFAQRLTDIMPFYGHRFSVKPGILGWAQMHIRREKVVPSESLLFEYDLYYVKEGSPLLDLEILIRTLLGGAAAAKRETPRVSAYEGHRA